LAPGDGGRISSLPYNIQMKRTWTIIGVGDVARSFKWYRSLFGQQTTRPHHAGWSRPSTHLQIYGAGSSS
jgi:hypothetical protein